jgi:PST family polysaccharide transporter
MLRFAGFTSAPILSALAPFIILPVVSRIVGEAGWANFSTGQSVGILGMVGILFGWGVVGPVRVARAHSEHERAAILRESLRSRLILSALVVPVVAVVTWLVCSDAYRLESVAVAVAMTLGGLTPAWFCIGQGNPRGVMVFDALPKLAASLVAFPILAFSGQVLWYPALLLAFTIPAFGVHAWLTISEHSHPDHLPRPVRRVLRSLVPTAAIDATGNAYGSTAIPIATAGLSPADASAFASADRAYRIGTLAVVAIANAFQAWVLERHSGDVRLRHLAALSAHAVLGAAGGAAIALLGPWATGLVFGAQVAAQPVPSALFGVAFFCISLATPLIRNLLIPADRFRIVLVATVSAAIVGLTVMLWGAQLGSAIVIATGVASSEFTALLVLTPAAIVEFRRLPALADV